MVDAGITISPCPHCCARHAASRPTDLAQPDRHASNRMKTSPTRAAAPPARPDAERAALTPLSALVAPTKRTRSVLFRLLIVAVAAGFTVHLASALVIAAIPSKSAERQLEGPLS